MARGTLITIEGIDGAGKSTLAAALQGVLAERGVSARLIREPGGVEVSERIRALVTDPSVPVSPPAEALLYAAARAQLVTELIEPGMQAGELLLLDRFTDSSLAYQGGGRRLGIEQIRLINRFATGGLEPDRTLLLRIEPAVARARPPCRSGPPTGSSARTRASSPRSPPHTRRSPPRSRTGSGRSTHGRRRGRC